MSVIIPKSSKELKVVVALTAEEAAYLRAMLWIREHETRSKPGRTFRPTVLTELERLASILGKLDVAVEVLT